MQTISATLRAALTLYASHIVDMQRAADRASPSDGVSMGDILAAHSRVEDMRKDLAEAFAHVHDMQRDRDWRSLDESADTPIPIDFPPGFLVWLCGAFWAASFTHLPTRKLATDYCISELRAAGWLK